MYLNNYISNIDNIELVNTINETATSFINRINDNFNINEQLNALLLGNVQSGKTAQMLGIISAMADDGYKMFLLLTTDNVDLHRQTYNRVKIPRRLTLVKDSRLSLMNVKILACVRKQYPKKFGANRFLPYLCIVNQR